MNDQPQNPHGPYGQHDPYDSRPRDPHSYDGRPHNGHPGDPNQPPYEPRHQYAPYEPGDPYARQPDWQPPAASSGHPYEDPQTLTWHGPTHEDTGTVHHAPYDPAGAAGAAHFPPARAQGPGPLPPEQSGALPPSQHQAADAFPAGGRAHPEGGAHAGVAPGGRAAGGAATVAPAAVTRGALTPAQLARAEGRSPIIPPGMQPALLTAGLSALLALAALLTGPPARPALAVPVVLLQALTAAGWYRLNGMWPARQGIALAFAGGVTTDIALLATAREHAPTVALGTLGVWCLLVLILQLRSHSSPDERLYALTAGVASTALTVLAAGHLAASAVSSDAVVIGAAAVAVATVTRALRLPPYVSSAAALIAAVGAGIAAGGATGVGASGALLGAAAGGCALIGLRVASYDYPSRFVHMTAGVALPLATAAPAVYVLARAIG
ncbi:hypothetical protein [Streptomyces sp. 7N604]|uniref:hypothetical protein n=1 Tax=Streptomyces sp. 7N604 TaxID=3457415 RepID=UPI003FD09680